MSRLLELAQRREALQLQAEDQRRAIGRQLAGLDQRAEPLRRAARWAGIALRAWKLWRLWRARR